MECLQAMALPVEGQSASRARQFVREVLDEWELRAMRDDAQLLTSELVTNALLHAGTSDIEIAIRRLDDGVRFEVSDRSAALPQLRHHSPTAGTGRGIALVQSWSRSWGTKARRAGKTVWFELADA